MLTTFILVFLVACQLPLDIPCLGRVDGFNQHQPARKTDDG